MIDQLRQLRDDIHDDARDAVEDLRQLGDDLGAVRDAAAVLQSLFVAPPPRPPVYPLDKLEVRPGQHPGAQLAQLTRFGWRQVAPGVWSR